MKLTGIVMSKVPVIWLSLRDDVKPRGQWDDAFLGDLLDGKFGDLGYELGGGIEAHAGLSDIPEKYGKGAIVVIHARHHAGQVREVNQELSKLDWCLVILTGDEESVFPADQLTHPNVKLWVMDPTPDKYEYDRALINGYAPATRELTKVPEKTLDWFFAGQLGHERRQSMKENLEGLKGGEAVYTGGFTQGLKPSEYYGKLSSAKLALCPSGPHTPDTFRVWEALELGCIPVVDTLPSKKGFPSGFWEQFTGEVPPFVFVNSWEGIGPVVEDALVNWKSKANKSMAWYKQLKRAYVKKLQADVFHLTKQEP